jgi:hypothetical protein
MKSFFNKKANDRANCCYGSEKQRPSVAIVFFNFNQCHHNLFLFGIHYVLVPLPCNVKLE